MSQLKIVIGRLFFFILSVIVASDTTYAQTAFKNSGARLVIKNGATINVKGGFENTSTGIVENDGILTVKGDFNNVGVFNSSITSKVIFDCDIDGSITSTGIALYNVEMNKDEGKKIVLLDELKVANNLKFNSNDNKIELGNNNIVIGASGTITGADDNDYIVTNGSGVLKKENFTSNSSFTFPVGFNASTYNPVVLTTNTGHTTDDLSVRCIENVLKNGNSGSILASGVVDVSWEIAEGAINGSDVNIQVQWVGSDELMGFDRTNCGVSCHNGDNWNLLFDDLGTSNGNNPYTKAKSHVTDFGVFGVGAELVSRELTMDIKAFLSGPYSGDIMADNLRAMASFPLTEPYTDLGLSQKGYGGDETILFNVLDNIGHDNSIVDWVVVELRDNNDHTNVKATKCALIQKDGDIVDLDGTSVLKIRGFADGNYYIAVKHRNHLGIMSSSTVSLSHTTTSYDFTGSEGMTFGGVNGIEELGDGNYGMFSGDFNFNAQVQNSDAAALIQTLGLAGYLSGDFDLNGQVQNTDIQLKLYPNLGRGQQF